MYVLNVTYDYVSEAFFTQSVYVSETKSIQTIDENDIIDVNPPTLLSSFPW